jgi:hypothetical protein
LIHKAEDGGDEMNDASESAVPSVEVG